MAITDELREYAQIAFDKGSAGRARVETIADHIDREHRMALEKVAAEVDEDAMEEHGWVKLPVDADGVPIHVGDVMEERSGHTFEVASLMAFGGSDNWIALSDPRNFSSFREPHDIRHYHAPTVEDVLREFAEKMNENLGMYTSEAIDADEWRDADRQTIAEYAKKLRLAEEVD